MRSSLAITLALSLSLPTLSTKEAAAKPTSPKSISLVVVGDVGLNRNGLPVDGDGIIEGTEVLAWDEISANIAPLIDGDLNFMNLETVVTDRNDLRPGNKGQKAPFLFRSHPNGLRKLIELGFNLISGANNHAYDYGEAGAIETLRHLQDQTEERSDVVYAGIGANDDEAARPASLRVGATKVAFAAIGIVTNMLNHHRAAPGKAGTLGFRYEEDWNRVVKGLRETPADLRILSVHYGKEKHVASDDKQRSLWRAAIDDGTADAVVGHHAHVVRGIELRRGKVIFYGLGNFMIRGAADMGKKAKNRIARDYGLLAKVHFIATKNGFQVGAIEAIPVFDMHRITRVLTGNESKQRIAALNVLAEELDDPKAGAQGVRFSVRKGGGGLFCSALGRKDKGEIGALCRGIGPAIRADKAVRAAVRRGR